MAARVVAFVRLSRAEFLLGGVVAVALGSSVAAYERGAFDWPAYAWVQFTLLAIHTMTHYANEYFDRETDALAVRTPYSGGSGILVDGALPPLAALVGAFAFGLCGLAGLAALAALGKGVAVAIGLTIVPLAWIYSAPPRLCARGLGELDTSLVVAVLAPLCAYAAQAGSLDARAVASTLPGALAMFAMMACVEVPDVAADAATGKRTLVVRVGVTRARCLMAALLAGVFIAVALAPLFGAPPAFVLLETLALAPALAASGAFARTARTGNGAGELAARGVSVFFLVEFLGALGYVCGLRW